MRGPVGLALGLQVPGDGVPVQGPAAGKCLDQLVGLTADLGGRGQDIPAAGAEVQVMSGQVAVALAGAGEVGVQPAAGGAHVGAGPGQQPGLAQLAEGGVPVPSVAVLVDV
jgi:hypothetical protein